MGPEAGQAWFRIAVLLTLVSAVLLFVTERGSAEFVVSGLTLIIGLVFMAVIVVLIRRASR